MPPASPRVARLRHRVAAVVLALALGAVALEGTVRFLLFSDVAADWEIARRLRAPRRFGFWTSDDAYYVLTYRWLPPERRATRPPWAPAHDARVGWTSDRFRPGDYQHADEARIGRRRLVLLFGDSFAAGVAGPESRFESLLESSARKDELALLNYGVPGFGLDQILLLLRAAVERFADAEPVVVVGLYVDDDLDRSVLRFRDWAKPRLQIADGRLIEPEEPVPTAEAFLAVEPPARRWWSLALAMQACAGRAPDGDARAAEKQELARACLRAVVGELRARDIPFAFLLFHGPTATADAAAGGWRLALVREELEALGAPWVEARDDLNAAARRAGRPVESYFRDVHLSAEGNAVVLATVLRAVAAAGG